MDRQDENDNKDMKDRLDRLKAENSKLLKERNLYCRLYHLTMSFLEGMIN